jgi:ribose-phosphate pyrophosphokinase
MKPVVVSLLGSEALAERLAANLHAEQVPLETRQFPDEETYLRYGRSVAGKTVLIVCSLDRPDRKFLPLAFAAQTARDLGARAVGLIAPYLAYMRQDFRFKPGEAVTSRCFGRLLSSPFDWLVTVDPHLHRHKSLDEIFSVPTKVVHAAPLISDWIKSDVERPLLLGPDAESEQWVSAVAHASGADFAVMSKIRRGDRDVEISLPALACWRDRTPVLIDDIASTARTMIEGVKRLQASGMRAPVCVAVHGIFAGDAYRALRSAGASRIVTTNTIPHESNAIDVTSQLAAAVHQLVG